MSKVRCWLLANNRAWCYGSQLFPFLFFSLAPYFTCNDSDPVQIWSHVTCESELHGWESRMACSILSLIGNLHRCVLTCMCMYCLYQHVLLVLDLLLVYIASISVYCMYSYVLCIGMYFLYMLVSCVLVCIVGMCLYLQPSGQVCIDCNGMYWNVISMYCTYWNVLHVSASMCIMCMYCSVLLLLYWHVLINVVCIYW